MGKAVKIGFVSLGCPKNQIDAEVMLHDLAEAGYEITGEDIEADIVIINTCAFITSAKQESIDSILDVAWLKEHRRLRGIIVTGCLAERYRDEVAKELPEVDALLGCGSIHDIVEAVKTVDEKTGGSSGSNGGSGSRKKGSKKTGSLIYSSFKPVEEVELGGARVLTTPDYYAYLKIAEGCDNRCTYCAIPGIRGRFRSRTIEDIVGEAKTLEASGVKELVLVAQDTTRYGIDIYGEYRLHTLIRAITDATSIPWIRLLYCYPDKLTDELLSEIANNPRVLKYIDIPIQHVDNEVLTRMNRHGGEEAVRSAVRCLREAVPGIILRTTVITGFPGETEEQFIRLCEFVRETKFERLGAFAYSEEEGTPAAGFDGQIDEQTKNDRSDCIMSIQADISAELCEKKLGKVITVLNEGYDAVSETWFGRSADDAPEIDGKVYFTTIRKPTPGEFLSVKITEALDYDLIGEEVAF